MVRIFFSHSTLDLPTVRAIKDEAASTGVEVYVHEDHPEPGTHLTDKLTQAIATSDAVIVLLTANAMPSSFVNQEIGVAIGKRIPIIPLVEVGMPPECLAMLQGLEYIPFQPDRLHEAIAAITERLHQIQEAKLSDELLGAKRQIQRQNQEMVAMGVIIVALIALLVYLETKG
jgi:hypothetical protein